MPPRKDANAVNVSVAGAQAQQDAISDGIENYELPKTLVTKVAKSVLPDNAKLQKETVTALMKGSTVFINYLAGTAHDIATSRQHKSISASDVLKALELISFGDVVEGLTEELRVYRELQQKTGKKGAQTAGKAKGKVMQKVPSIKISAPKGPSVISSSSIAGPSGAFGHISNADSMPASATASLDDLDEEMLDAVEGGDEEGDIELLAGEEDEVELLEQEFAADDETEDEVDQLADDIDDAEVDDGDQMLEDRTVLDELEAAADSQRSIHGG